MPWFAPDFHFLRPFWFLALMPALIFLVALWFSRLRESGWDQVINQDLLPHLLDATPAARRRWPLFMLFLAWLLAVCGLAGPTWQRLPQPVRQKEDALVIIQDLSLSFYAQDLSPNRLTRARHKISDILKSRREGLTGLIVYAGDAHVVSPLTDDTNTIAAMVGDLDPGIMPSYGSNLKAAVDLAIKLFRDGFINRGRILLLTDEVSSAQASAVSKLLDGHDFTIDIIGVGTGDGAPIPKGDGGFLKDDQGRIIVPRLNRAELSKLAAANGGAYRDITIDDSDFHELLSRQLDIPRSDEYRQSKRKFDQWQDQGYWLVVLLIPLALLAFRRGWLLVALFFGVTLFAPANGYALGWRDLWLRHDQQAAQALAANKPKKAATLFQSPSWQGVAQYRAGNFDKAAAAFSRQGSADDNYNHGNALARLGRLQEAIQAYDEALKLNPKMTDARDNRDLVTRLLHRQKQQNRKDKKGKGGKKDQKGKKGQKGKEGQKGTKGRQQAGDGSAAKSGEGKHSPERGKDKPAHRGDESARNDRQSHENSPAVPPANKPEGLGKKSDKGPGKKASKGESDLKNDKLSPEQRQALSQWLRQVPDDPGGLLRRKFKYQYQNKRSHNQDANHNIW